MPKLTAILDSNPYVAGAAAMVNATTSIYNSLNTAFNSMQKFESTMTVFSGSLAASKEDLSRLMDITLKLGTNFEAAAGPFAKFAASAKDFSKSEIFDMFESFSTAASALKMTKSDVDGMFLALQQMASKGKISMEELRLQLAERVPGAMKIAADSMEMTVDQLESSIRKGLVGPREFLLNFSREIKDTFQEGADVAAKSWKSSLDRLSTTFFVFKAALVEETGVSGIWKQISDGMREALSDQDIFQGAGESLISISNIAKNLFNMFDGLLKPALSGANYGLERLSVTVSGIASVWHMFEAATLTSIIALKKFYLSILDIGNVGGALDGKMKKVSESIDLISKDRDKSIKEWFNAVDELGVSYTELKNPISAVNTEASKGAKAIELTMAKLKDSASAVKDSLKKDLNDRIAADKEKTKSVDDMFKTAGLSGDEFYVNEANKLIQRVSGWQANGASIVESNQWLYDELAKLESDAMDAGYETASARLEVQKSLSSSLVDTMKDDFEIQKGFFEELSKQADMLDGKEIKMLASLDGTMLISNLDDIMSKFNQFQQAASNANDYIYNYDESKGDFTEWNNSTQPLRDSANKSSNNSVTNINVSTPMNKKDVSDLAVMQQRQAAQL